MHRRVVGLLLALCLLVPGALTAADGLHIVAHGRRWLNQPPCPVLWQHMLRSYRPEALPPEGARTKFLDFPTMRTLCDDEGKARIGNVDTYLRPPIPSDQELLAASHLGSDP